MTMSTQQQGSRTTAQTIARVLRSTPVLALLGVAAMLIVGAAVAAGPGLRVQFSGRGAMAAPIEATAQVQASWTLGKPVSLDDVQAGELLQKTDKGLVPLPVERTDVELRVTGPMIHGRVTQRFANPGDDAIEALYAFPLPEGAAVQHMEMRIGERRIVSRIRERAEARKEYERARAEGRRAALVEQQRPNLFTNSVANIQPGETVEVVLEYVDEARQADGEYSLAFPLTFTPRFHPPGEGAESCPDGCDDTVGSGGGVSGSGSSTPAAGGPFVHARRASAPRAQIKVALQSDVDLERIESSSHAVGTRRSGSTWQVTPVDGSVPADRDFTLRWLPTLEEQPQASLYVERKADGRYGLLTLMPPAADAAAAGMSTETMFVIDVSGSMEGPSIRQAREALVAALDRLRPGDRFNVLEFNDGNALMAPEMQLVQGPDSVADARRWARRLSAGGGTMILPALKRALAEMASQPESRRAQRIVFLTDGAVGNEDQIFAALGAQLGRARLHTIGIGAAPNRYLMRKMARFGRGLCAFAAEGDSADNAVAAFFERIDRPVMTDLALSWEGIRAEDIYPRRLPDLHAGEPLVLSFRLRGEPSDGAAVKLSGRLPGGVRALSLPVPAGSRSSSGVAARWARARVANLMDTLHEGASEDDVRPKVVRVGKSFHLVTRYTSLVAVEERVAGSGDPRPVQLANADPASADDDASLPAGGTDAPLLTLIGGLLLAAGAALALTSRQAWRTR